MLKTGRIGRGPSESKWMMSAISVRRSARQGVSRRPSFLAAMRSTVSSLKDSCVSDFTACSEVSATMRPDAVPPAVWRSSAVPLAARNAAPQRIRSRCLHTQPDVTISSWRSSTKTLRYHEGAAALETWMNLSFFWTEDAVVQVKSQ